MNPDVYLFNPTCEYAVANQTVSWQPNRLLRQMETDLACLPQFFARPGDYVLTDKLPSEKCLERCSRVGIEGIRFVKKEGLSDPGFQQIPKNRLLPWGWSPAAHHLLEPLKPSCSPEFLSSPNASWKPGFRDLYSRKTAKTILESLLSKNAGKYLLPLQSVPACCNSIGEFGRLAKNREPLMVKAPWSASGRGLQPVTVFPVHPSVMNKISGMIKSQGYVLVEPLLDKILDFSFQFQLRSQKTEFIGISYFSTDTKGQYQGSYLNGPPVSTAPDVLKFAEENAVAFAPVLADLIDKNPVALNYCGYFGIDAMVYRSREGELRFYPCVEINLRYNFGILTLKLQELVAPGAKGIVRTCYNANLPFSRYAAQMESLYPLRIENGKIISGFFPLADEYSEADFGAYLLVYPG